MLVARNLNGACRAVAQIQGVACRRRQYCGLLVRRDDGVQGMVPVEPGDGRDPRIDVVKVHRQRFARCGLPQNLGLVRSHHRSGPHGIYRIQEILGPI